VAWTVSAPSAHSNPAESNRELEALVNPSLRKLIRTVQSHLYFLKETRDVLYHQSRRIRGIPHEQEFLALKFIPDGLSGVYVDIGANQGQSIESIKVVKPSARIVSFEANQGLAEKLQARYRGRSDIQINAFGLSDEVDEKTLFVPVYRKFVYDGNASFDRDYALALYNSSYLYWFSPSALELREVPCSLKRLDDQNLEPLFMKLDVQGFEFNVVKGGIETIRRHEPILMIECLHDHREMADLLASLGYEEYIFDETGFVKGKSNGGLNQIVMTPRRTAVVQMSSRRAN
jgi:FkbM family methyltransferase